MPLVLRRGPRTAPWLFGADGFSEQTPVHPAGRRISRAPKTEGVLCRALADRRTLARDGESRYQLRTES